MPLENEHIHLRKFEESNNKFLKDTGTFHHTWMKNIQDLGECPASDPDAEELSLSESATNIIYVKTIREKVPKKNLIRNKS